MQNFWSARKNPGRTLWVLFQWLLKNRRKSNQDTTGLLSCLTLEAVGLVMPTKPRPDVRPPNSTDLFCLLVLFFPSEIHLDMASTAVGPNWGLHRYEPKPCGSRFV